MLAQAPTSIITYSVDWSAQYPTDPIVSFTATPNGGISVPQSSQSGQKILFNVTGGTVGSYVSVLVKITLTSGQVDQYTFPLLITNT